MVFRKWKSRVEIIFRTDHSLYFGYLFDLVKQTTFFSFQVGRHGQNGVLVVKVVAAANKNAIGNAI